MATIDKITALLKAHYDSNDETFNTLALQIAASEAKIGHAVAAKEIKDIVEKYRYRKTARSVSFMNDGLDEMIQRVDVRYSLQHLIVEDATRSRIERIITEYRERNRLRRNGLVNRSKVLLAGPSGTGKTMTANVIASETDLPLFVIRMDKIITKFMGASSAKLGQVFDAIEQYDGVYLFDEFDALGIDRKRDNEVGEMRRILTSFLMFMEHVESNSIIVCATNQINVLDNALFRRFDDVIHFNLPNLQQIEKLVAQHLDNKITAVLIPSIAQSLEGYSHAVVCAICKDAIKESILNDKRIDMDMIRRVTAEKQDYILAV